MACAEATALPPPRCSPRCSGPRASTSPSSAPPRRPTTSPPSCSVGARRPGGQLQPGAVLRRRDPAGRRGPPARHSRAGRRAGARPRTGARRLPRGRRLGARNRRRRRRPARLAARAPHVSAEPTPFKAAAVQLDSIAPVIAGEALESLRAGYPPAASFNEKQLARAQRATRRHHPVHRRRPAGRRPDGADRDARLAPDVPHQPRCARRGAQGRARALAPVIRRTDPGAARLVLDAMRDEPAFTPPGESG